MDILDGVKATCIDAGNPCVFIEAADIEVDGTILPDDIDAHPTLLFKLDSIRRKASVAMCLSKDEESTPGSIPKIAMVSRPKSYKLLSAEMIEGNTVDLVVRALSVGQPHKAVRDSHSPNCSSRSELLLLQSLIFVFHFLKPSYQK